jgi:hypothetical protein
MQAPEAQTNPSPQVPQVPPHPSEPHSFIPHLGWHAGTQFPFFPQYESAGQIPQYPPHPSFPHSRPAQSGLQSDWQMPPVHQDPALQDPHDPPHPSSPHWTKSHFGTHPTHCPSTHAIPSGHVPQEPPHASGPQTRPPHWESQPGTQVPALHEKPAAHSPQDPPHPSPPQALPVHDGVQRGTHVDSAQNVPSGQVPQVPPHPSGPQPFPAQDTGLQAAHDAYRSLHVVWAALYTHTFRSAPVDPQAAVAHCTILRNSTCSDAGAVWDAHPSTHFWKSAPQATRQSSAMPHDRWYTHLPWLHDPVSAQVPQAPPHPSGPHSFPAQDGTQTHCPALHVLPGPQVPHDPPHPSSPQASPWQDGAQSGTHSPDTGSQWVFAGHPAAHGTRSGWKRSSGTTPSGCTESAIASGSGNDVSARWGGEEDGHPANAKPAAAAKRRMRIEAMEGAPCQTGRLYDFTRRGSRPKDP